MAILNPKLEKRINKLISKYDHSRICFEEGVEHVVHVGEPHYTARKSRKRFSYEISIAKLTRKLFFTDTSEKAFRSNLDEKLDEYDRQALVYFTRKRKELGAMWVDLLKQGLANSFSSSGIFHESKPIRYETDFLDFLMKDAFKGGKAIYSDKELSLEVGGHVSTYSAREIANAWVHGTKKAKFDYFRSIRTEGSETPLQMHALYVDNYKANKNIPIMIFGRVKHSDSANIKQAQVWAEELDLCDKIKLAKSDSGTSEFQRALDTVSELYGKPPKSSAYVRIFKEKNGPGANPTRFNELSDNWRYDIEDLFGITIVLSREYSSEFTESLITQFSKQDGLFIFEKGSEDDHTKDADKPDEFQFKVRVNREFLYKNFPSFANEIYMPDTIEIQVTSAPDLVHKQLAPYLAERYYKRRMALKRLKTPGAKTYFNTISDLLTKISPVGDTMGKKEADLHYQRVIDNLQNGSDNFTVEYEPFRNLGYLRYNLFK